MSFQSATTDLATLSKREQVDLLRATGTAKGAEREHMLYSMGLGTALREAELVALNVGDVIHDGLIRSKILLTVYKGSARRTSQHEATNHRGPGQAWRRKPIRQIVFLPKLTRRKLEYFIDWKRKAGESLIAAAPLFVTSKASATSSAGDRLSTRAVRHHFRLWQRRCGFETLHGFHVLRHTAISNIYRATKDIRTAQKVARHANVNTTQIYTHLTDEEIAAKIEGLAC